jgi:hypothetical protein
MSNKPTQAAAVADVQALIAGTQKHFPNGQFTFGSTVYTTASLVQIFQDLIAAIVAVAPAQATASDVVAARHAMEAKADPVIQAYKSYLRVTFSDAKAQLTDFGMQASKARTPVRPETRLAATAKAKATRIARGTVGKKKKLTIHGDVTGVIVTPVTATGPLPSPQTVAPASPAGATAPASTTTTAPAVTVAK